MPARNSVKVYTQHGYYHLYNRGVEKRDIFLNRQDYTVFLSYLHEYLTPKDIPSLHAQLTNLKVAAVDKYHARRTLRMNNFSEDISLLAYCLMPNHFHLLLKQTTPHTIDRFMNSLGTRYTMYFNKKYKRVGSLYQGVYKAAPILYNNHLLYLSRYIHTQAYRTQPCSYEEYLGKRHTPWVKPDEILHYFFKHYPDLSYETFMKHPDDNLSFPTLEPEEH